MGRIRVLSDAVANQIAAGEVVERPASVVKELLENSIDAGATDIRVSAENAGRRLIRVRDNGCGMMRDDAMLAFERHATSKLHAIADLTSIATLGFRGEALPSIASVSRLLLETRSADQETGTVVELAGGKLLRCDEAALPAGATVTVRDLFYNVPARRKFLRSDQTELAHLASLVTHYSLAHPDKRFELHNGSSELLNVPPAGALRERVYQVFGGQLLEDLIEIEYREREMRPAEDAEPRVFALRGFVSRPQLQKANRNSVYLFVNGRLIRDKLLLHAITAAYHNLMPAGCYPFALLFLDCDCEEVDVNVHPSKTEVRFRHASFVHDFVRDELRELFMISRPGSSVPLAAVAQPAAEMPFSEWSSRMGQPPAVFDSVLPAFPAPAAAPPPPSEAVWAPAGPRAAEGEAPARYEQRGDPHGGFPPELYAESPEDLRSLSNLRPIGQLHDSFIIAAGRDGLWIIDQHVAHERVLFEKVLRERASGGVESQRLLMPAVIELTPGQLLQYSRIADELNQSGFETEPFGQRTIAIKAAPAAVSANDIERIVFEILEVAESEARKTSLDDLRRGIAASIACRAAIKINTRLDSTKMDWLLRSLAACEFPMSCPHGRPIALRYGTRDILRSFHRI